MFYTVTLDSEKALRFNLTSFKFQKFPVSMLLLSNQKQPSCKKRCGPQKGHGEKRCEIQGGGQEMAVMIG